MEYVAAWMIVAFLGTMLLRRIFYTRAAQQYLHRRCRIGCLTLAAVVQPYNFFLAVLSYVLAVLSAEWVGLVQASDRLAPGRGYDMHPFVRHLALLSLPLVACTFAITVVHMRKHLPRHRGFDEDLRWFPSFSHDLAMQVLALPLVYGICSFSNVCDLLPAMAEKPDDPQAIHSFKTNNQIADLYEAWALRCFGGACIALVHRQITLETPTVQYIIDYVRKEVEHGLGEEHAGFQHLNTEMKMLRDPQKYLFQPLQTTVKVGMRFFIVTCAVRSLYLLAIDAFDIRAEHGPYSAAFFSLTQYVDGAMMLASTIAIYDLISFEHFLAEILNKDQNDFKAFSKFLCVKAMVTLAFIQEFLLDLINRLILAWTDEQIKLCYACLVCCEVFVLSIIVFLAWAPKTDQDDWYSGDHCECAGEKGQLACEDNEVQPYLSPQDVLQLLNLDRWEELERGRQIQHKCAGVLELHGNVGHTEGEALENLVNALSTTCKAHFTPMFWFKFSTDEAARAASRAPSGEGGSDSAFRIPLLELQQVTAPDVSFPSARTARTWMA